MHRVRWHGSWGHGLYRGDTEYILCHMCKIEKAAGVKPDITGSDPE